LVVRLIGTGSTGAGPEDSFLHDEKVKGITTNNAIAGLGIFLIMIFIFDGKTKLIQIKFSKVRVIK
jgi:hypothetical protein